MCECILCGRLHRKLGVPPWYLNHGDLCRLSRAFNDSANLALTQDYRINEWLKKLLEIHSSTNVPQVQSNER